MYGPWLRFRLSLFDVQLYMVFPSACFYLSLGTVGEKVGEKSLVALIGVIQIRYGR